MRQDKWYRPTIQPGNSAWN